MENNLKNSVLLILCYYRAIQSDGTIYDNREDDLSTSVLFASQDRELTKQEFKKIVLKEKEKSWLANFSSYLPDYIDKIEEDEEFYCHNKQTNEFTHIQIVHSPLAKNE